MVLDVTTCEGIAKSTGPNLHVQSSIAVVVHAPTDAADGPLPNKTDGTALLSKEAHGPKAWPLPPVKEELQDHDPVPGKGVESGQVKGKGKGKGPPPPGGKGKGKDKAATLAPEPKKPIITPEKEMKPLRWKRFQLGWNLENGSIWDEVNKLPDVDLPLDQLVNLFSKTAAAQKKRVEVGTVADKKDSAVRAKELHIIEGTIQRCGRESALTKLPPATSVANAIREFNKDTLLTSVPTSLHVAELLRLLRDNVCPTLAQKEKLEQAKEATPDVLFGNIEQYMWEISRVPAYMERLECWLYLSTWEEDLKPVRTNLEHFGVIVECFRSSALPELLGMVLSAGNYLNGGTKEGRADGFHLDILKTGGIESVRDSQSKGDLRHFIFSTYLTKCRQGATALLKDLRPALKNIRRMLENVEGGGVRLKKTVKISLEHTIDEALSRIHAEFSKKHGMLEAVLNKDQDSSTSVGNIQEEFDQVLLKISDIQHLRDRAKDKYAKLLSWMHHSSQECSEEFLLMWDDMLIPKERFETQGPSKVKSVLKPIFCEDAAEIDVYGLGKLWEVEVGGLAPQTRRHSATPRTRRPLSLDDGQSNPRRTASLNSLPACQELESDWHCSSNSKNDTALLHSTQSGNCKNPPSFSNLAPCRELEGDSWGSNKNEKVMPCTNRIVPPINFRNISNVPEKSQRGHPQVQRKPTTPREPYFKMPKCLSTLRKDMPQHTVQIHGSA